MGRKIDRTFPEGARTRLYLEAQNNLFSSSSGKRQWRTRSHATSVTGAITPNTKATAFRAMAAHLSEPVSSSGIAMTTVEPVSGSRIVRTISASSLDAPEKWHQPRAAAVFSITQAARSIECGASEEPDREPLPVVLHPQRDIATGAREDEE